MLRGASPYAERFLTGEKSALLAFAVPADRCQITPGAPWQPRDRVFEHGKFCTSSGSLMARRCVRSPSLDSLANK